MNKGKFWLTILGVPLMVVISYQWGLFQYLSDGLNNANNWILELGSWGAIAFIIIYIIATIFLIPGSALTLGAGLIFGVIKGTIFVSIGSVMGATVSFLIGRYFLRTWVEKQIDTQPNFKAMDKAVAQQGWKIVGLTRLSPLFPFVFLNYAFGVTQVSLRDFVFASWLGMLPGTVMYVYLGSLPKTAAAVSGGDTDTLKLILNIIGLIATVAVTVYVTKIAQKALEKEVN
ncbi:MAG: TVP38/TMEM64 family protein [Cyanobacteria bacterium]|nr:TVP38/TMEM64 family protein [Cyanobacteria bacterium CG_2015-16_32_12]NCO76875.1 TVP38/TMEM64 family protein [Cyanobacteria bacterium CG_2015-22_32_23]NCQ03328.1 TVP38/TMEM64 family protein [Cyanobacteria bacterium CG_2015-09_32_10]NCQ43123.1 TVP38/TMEM64 family protein [Cyanobacteria bacterium CG_2015-04_32_10]NCS84367.1 TVP38/TMEM64 family protein [Cyanobacteria bacterium CG_2015-02_32_10]